MTQIDTTGREVEAASGQPGRLVFIDKFSLLDHQSECIISEHEVSGEKELIVMARGTMNIERASITRGVVSQEPDKKK